LANCCQIVVKKSVKILKQVGEEEEGEEEEGDLKLVACRTW
jgi:hypothetical protein